DPPSRSASSSPARNSGLYSTSSSASAGKRPTVPSLYTTTSTSRPGSRCAASRTSSGNRMRPSSSTIAVTTRAVYHRRPVHPLRALHQLHRLAAQRLARPPNLHQLPELHHAVVNPLLAVERREILHPADVARAMVAVRSRLSVVHGL